MRDPYILEKFTREISHARKLAREYFAKYPPRRASPWRQESG
jgi:hypothetical protein